MENQEQAGYRFYNAGEKIDEHWSFSISASSPGYNHEGADSHSIGKFNFVAPKQGWCFVPSEMQTGNEVVRVNFPEDAKRKYGRRGIVMLDPRHRPETEDPGKPLEQYPVAPTEELVIERAEALWKQFLEQICSAHFEDVQNAMAQGSRPRAASGFTVHALKLLGYRDPAAEFLQGMREGRNGVVPQSATSPELLGILKAQQEQSKLMMSILVAIASGQKIDPELLKQMISPEPEPPKAPAPLIEPPINAGDVEVDGTPKSGLQERINRRTSEYETAATRVGGKKERAAAAAREL